MDKNVFFLEKRELEYVPSTKMYTHTPTIIHYLYLTVLDRLYNKVGTYSYKNLILFLYNEYNKFDITRNLNLKNEHKNLTKRKPES